jgi:hypothetical protein
LRKFADARERLEKIEKALRLTKQVATFALSAVDEYGIIFDEVPVAQWIEHWSPDGSIW